MHGTSTPTGERLFEVAGLTRVEGEGSLRLVVRDGPDGEVFLPVLYPGAEAAADDAIRLGRATAWRGEGDDPVRGVGQKTFLVGEEDVPLLELTALAFGEPAGS